MERDQYISHRKNNDFNIVYEFYKEKYDSKKHKVFLSINDLVLSLQSTGYDVRQVMNNCVEHYDEKFNIIKVYKDDNLIAIL